MRAEGGKKGLLLGLAQAAWDRIPVAWRRRVLFFTNDHFLVGVVGLIRDQQGRVLLLEHRFRTPWRWGLPGGFINRGETFSAGLARELDEELGLAIAPDPQLFDTEHFLPGGYVSITMTARALGPLELPEAGHGEITGGGWYGPEDTLPEGLYPYHRTLVLAYWRTLQPSVAPGSPERQDAAP